MNALASHHRASAAAARGGAPDGHEQEPELPHRQPSVGVRRPGGHDEDGADERGAVATQHVRQERKRRQHAQRDPDQPLRSDRPPAAVVDQLEAEELGEPVVEGTVTET